MKKRLERITLEEYHEIMDTNLKASSSAQNMQLLISEIARMEK